MHSAVYLVAILALAFSFGLVSSQQIAGARQSKNCELMSKKTGRLHNLDCILDPESIEGPYYLPLNISRPVIHEGHPGIPFTVNLVIMNNATCSPVPNAIVDLWHANASGIYSGFDIEGTAGETYCRGTQTTDLNGEVTFQTIFPGWYLGRALHMHIEVYVGGSLKHIGQLYFPEPLGDHIRPIPPYSSNTQPYTYNHEDTWYITAGGAETTLDPTGYIDSALHVTQYIGIGLGAEDEKPMIHSFI